ncbi:hypothetical protein [Burkholderia pseudomallei]|uniref:hypothetical protein n=1 Tax=Burkholderia pseudomallei TaxID=28450 RepID=UPI0031331888
MRRGAAPKRRAPAIRHKLITKRYKRESRARDEGLTHQLQCRFWRRASPPLYIPRYRRRSVLNDPRCDRSVHQVQIHGLRRCVPCGLFP